VVEPERVEAGLLEQGFDDLREPVERVVEPVGDDGIPETRVVRREDVEPIGERRNQVAELVGRGGEAAEQQQLRARRVSGLAVEHGDSLDVGCPVSDHGPCSFLVSIAVGRSASELRRSLRAAGKNSSTGDAEGA